MVMNLLEGRNVLDATTTQRDEKDDAIEVEVVTTKEDIDATGAVAAGRRLLVEQTGIVERIAGTDVHEVAVLTMRGVRDEKDIIQDLASIAGVV